jgi:L-ascorbate metabolism protein UlaG (beta-lactamase superfamily)
LGALSDIEIGKEAREVIEEPDILFIPVGDKGSKNEGILDVKDSAKLASSLEPGIVIPMDYDETTLKAFLKEMGEEKAEVVEKLTLKKKDLEGKESEVVVLKAS